jgi:hypothetical protein
VAAAVGGGKDEAGATREGRHRRAAAPIGTGKERAERLVVSDLK